MLDFRPDQQPSTPGTLVTCSNVIPTKDGSYFTSWVPVNAGYSALGASPIIARMLKTPTTSRLVVGTANKLYEANGSGGWTDRSAASYGLTGTQRWWITQYGDETIACTPAYATQTSTTGSFANLSNAPKAKVMLSQSGHLLALNYDDGTANPSGIKWSSQGSSTTWTAGAGNSAGSATLRESVGPIVGGCELHDVVAVWKSSSMYVGRRVGGTEIWRFNLLSPKVGLVHQDAWHATPVGIIFVSENGVYRWDGSVPQPIDEGVRIKFYTKLATSSSSIQMTHDESRNCVFFWLFGATECWSYNYLSQKWSVAYASTSNLGSSTYASAICTVRDANFSDCSTLAITGAVGSNQRTAHLIFTGGPYLVNLSGESPDNTFVSTFESGIIRSGDAGPDDQTEVTRIVPAWAWESGSLFSAADAKEPTAATLVLAGFSRPTAAAASATGSKTVSMNANKRFDVTLAANALRAQLTVTDGYFGISDIGYFMRKAGKR